MTMAFKSQCPADLAWSLSHATNAVSSPFHHKMSPMLLFTSADVGPSSLCRVSSSSAHVHLMVSSVPCTGSRMDSLHLYAFLQTGQQAGW